MEEHPPNQNGKWPLRFLPTLIKSALFLIGIPVIVAIILYRTTCKSCDLAASIIISVFPTIFMVLSLVRGFEEWKNKHQSNIALQSMPAIVVGFHYETLKRATKEFSKTIGKGGFGTVYEGVLNDGIRIAVKCLKTTSYPYEDHVDLDTEFNTMSAINHINLISLLGFCRERNQRLLVYEFMENGSLDRWIFGSKEEKNVLDWKTRYNIAVDIARGLSYLHHESRQCVLHLDIKPENILLDEFFRANVSDFGLAKCLRRDLESRLMTSGIKGTRGYMAPEWLYQRSVTPKSDVFSFGVVILEIVCGKRCVQDSDDDEDWYLPLTVFRKAMQGMIEDVLEIAIGRPEKMVGDIVKMLKIGLWCVQGNPAIRPSMNAIVRMLEGDLEVRDPPLDPHLPFASLSDSVDGDVNNILSSSQA